MADDHVTWGDNVIYADFGARGARRGAAKRAARGKGRGRDSGARPVTPVARRLYDAVADAADAARRTRGEKYFADGHVLGHRMVDGQIIGEVKGSQLEPFSVVIRLPRRDNADVNELLRWLAETTGAAGDFDKGILPADRLDEILLDEEERAECRCSCPDPSTVCKHAVAVAAAAGREIDSSPMAVLELRGVSALEARHRLAGLMARANESLSRRGPGAKRSTGPTTSAPVLEVVERDFWGADLPSVEIPAPAGMNPLNDTDPTLLHAALRPTTVLSHETLRAVSDLEDCWEHLKAPPSFGDSASATDGSGPAADDDDGVVALSFDDEDDGEHGEDGDGAE